MNAAELTKVLADRGFEIPNVFRMDATQMVNVNHWLEDEMRFTADMMAKDLDPETWLKTYIVSAGMFAAAQRQMVVIMDSPLVEISAHDKELTTFRVCEVWDDEVCVNLAPTEEFAAFMREHILDAWEGYQRAVPQPLGEVWWKLVGSHVGRRVKFIEGEVTRAEHPIDAEGLLRDYAIHVGITVTDKTSDGTVLTPMRYIEEFSESAWQPEEAAVREFLGNFHTEQQVEEFCEKFAWDNEAND